MAGSTTWIKSHSKSILNNQTLAGVTQFRVTPLILPRTIARHADFRGLVLTS